MNVVLNGPEARQLLAAIPAGHPFAQRNRALVVLDLHTGLRVSELSGLDVHHVAQGNQVRQTLHLPAELQSWATGRRPQPTPNETAASDHGGQGTEGHNGSVRAITDSSRAVVAHYEYGAWGEVLGSSSAFSGGFSYGYVGSLGVRTDEATGLIWMRHRWYDPNGLQRFLSRDVLGSLNRYEYCHSNPVNWVDLDGLKPEGGGNHMKTGSDGVNLYYNDASLTGMPNGIPWDWQKRREPDGTNFYSNYFMRKKLPKYDLPEIKLPKFSLDFPEVEVECPDRPLTLPDLPRWEFPMNRPQGQDDKLPLRPKLPRMEKPSLWDDPWWLAMGLVGLALREAHYGKWNLPPEWEKRRRGMLKDYYRDVDNWWKRHPMQEGGGSTG